MRSVDDLGVELDAVDAALGVLEGRDRRRRRGGDDARTGRRRDDRVAVAHPAVLLLGEGGEELALALDAQVGPPELRPSRPLDAAAEVPRQELHAVADPEDGDAQLVELRVDLGRAVGVDRGRAAREDECERPARARSRGGERVRDELRVDARLADPACDQLRVLAAAVDDEDRALFGCRLVKRDDARRLRHPMPMRWACWRALPSVLIAGASATSARWKSWMFS